jgi:hypothetical protein
MQLKPVTGPLCAARWVSANERKPADDPDSGGPENHAIRTCLGKTIVIETASPTARVYRVQG